MSDIEGLVKALLKKNKQKDSIIQRLCDDFLVYKNIGREQALEMAKAVFNEVLVSNKRLGGFLGELLSVPESSASMHDLGVGCRGEGDFFVHTLLAKISSLEDEEEGGMSRGSSKILMGPLDQDDAGAVHGENDIIVIAVDGTHSRLSDFPFIAGFHVARASLRDVYVKGAIPVAMLTDVHLADDGDVGKLFDFSAGIRAVSELSKVPLVAGSTLRVGGDMVIGNRLVSCVGTVGVVPKYSALASRKNIRPGDKVLMTEGAGGGTITTTAIYNDYYDAIIETLNVQFIRACEALQKEKLFSHIHALADWTNGGIRGDISEICKTAKVGIKVDERKIEALLNEKVLRMLEELSIDYLGVSMDALLIFCPENIEGSVLNCIKKIGIKIDVIGKVTSDPKKGILIDKNGEEKDLHPKFREAAYTKIKKVVGETAPKDKEEMMERAREAAELAIEKAEKVVKFIKQRQKFTE
ncbi:MAG: AIR synthase-related protein [Candidatus Hodarchaeota archaeon]